MTAIVASHERSKELGAIKERQQRMWASGDYSAVAARIHPIAERLCDVADLQAGSKVLDVATGSGNAAIAAARCGCDVVGIDYVPALMDNGRARARAEGLVVDFVEADAEALPFPDASFDAVLSVMGVMFAPDQERAAAEMLRVCRPGGTIALASWTPGGFVGDLLRLVGRYAPPPPGVRSPIEWGSLSRLSELLGSGVTRLDAHEREYTFRHRSADEFAHFFLANYGPTERAAATLDGPRRAEMRTDLAALAAGANRLPAGGPVAIPAMYLEAVAVRT
jgi:ubiquinone/menaquinone biosynthesis C-methylase UbiE